MPTKIKILSIKLLKAPMPVNWELSLNRDWDKMQVVLVKTLV
jgi:hypothetical protein